MISLSLFNHCLRDELFTHLQEEGDYHGAKNAFSQARAIFTDRFGKHDHRARSAAASAVAAHRMTAPPSPAVGRAFNARKEAMR